MLAFASKVIPECEKIKEDPVASRKAFAVWIGLCMVDGQYTEDDKIYIKTLQQLFIKRVDPENPLPDLLTPTTSLLGMVSPSLMSLYIGGKVVLHNMQRQANSEPITYENVISDELLEEIIEDCRMLSDLKRQIDLTTDGDSKSSLQNSFTYIENNLKDLIKNGLN